jgi:hypothetical protein
MGVEMRGNLAYTFGWGRDREFGFDRLPFCLEVCSMRLAAVLLATLPLTAAPCLAQNAPVMSVTPVSFALPAEVPSARGDVTDGKRDVPFDMGRPEGSGFDDVPAKRAVPRAAVRVAERRAKKAFGVPWQTGIFQ